MSENTAYGRLQAPPEFISVISANQCARIRINDIEMIEQEGRRVHIITAEKDYSFYGDLNGIATSLADRAFYRVLSGMIVNFDHVKDITGITINFHSGQTVTLGRNAITKTKRAYKRYLMKYPPYSLWDPYRVTPLSVFETSDELLEDLSESTSENT